VDFELRGIQIGGTRKRRVAAGFRDNVKGYKVGSSEVLSFLEVASIENGSKKEQRILKTET